jgi:DNA repair protein RecO (recombination protein O)
MMEENNLCIVLRAVNYRDHDRILTLFSREEGRITAQATGARRLKSALSVAAQPFCCAEYEFYTRGGRHYIKNALIREKFFRIQNDYEKYTAGCVMLELAEHILRHAGDWGRLFARLAYTLYAMEADTAGADAALAYFLVQAAEILGVFPAVDFCAVCGREMRDATEWSAAHGGAVCADCAPVCGATRVPAEFPYYFTVLRRV